MLKVTEKWKVALLVLLMMTFFLIGVSARKVSADTYDVGQCRVVFANSKGVVSTDLYKSWEKIVDTGSYITLPEYSKSGYRIYWTVKYNGKTTKYTPGASVQITRNTKFCMKYYKLYTVRFYNPSGKGEFKNLRVQAIKGERITLPERSLNSATKTAVWATKIKGTSTKKPGASVKVTGNMKFYVVVKSAPSGVKLCYNTGGVWKTITNTAGTATFPAVNMKNGDMCLGWSRKKGKSTLPNYKTGDKIPSKSGTYYMVVFKKSMDREPAQIKTLTSYDSVYFVGDSRTWGMMLSLGERCPSNVHFVYRRREGLSWLKSDGYKKLLSRMSNEPADSKKAVIFNFGINDLNNVNKYVKYMKNISGKLKRNNCDLYYMSVNPYNSAMYAGSKSRRSEAKVASFNKTIYNKLCKGRNKSYTYINTCTGLQKYGWISTRPEDGVHDGLHYSVATYLRIYNYCINYLNRY